MTSAVEPLADPTHADPQLVTDERMSQDEVVNAVRTMLDQARTYSLSTLTTFRQRATEYYLGKPFGNEVEGRSQFVMTEVRDTVKSMLPSLMRVFFGGERAVEFRPRREEDVAAADQATDYVNYLVCDENDGFLVLHSAFKDALIRRLGIIKYWWEDPEPVIEEATLHGVSREQLQAIQLDLSIVSGDVLTQNEDGTFEVRVRHKKEPEGRLRIAAVQPEEFFYSPNARSLDDALMVAHATWVRKSDLVAMGYDSDDIDRAGATKVRVPPLEDYARQPEGLIMPEMSPEPGTDRVYYQEVYCYLDEDGDGIAEHRRIVLLGEGRVIPKLKGEPDDHPFEGRPFALFCPDPEPHTITGMGVADDTMDLQLVKSATMRAMLDSLAFAVNPRIAFVEGQVNATDLMNTEIGSLIRMRQPAMIQEVKSSFVGKEALPMLMLFDEIKENRTGMSRAAMGLNADALQSSTRAAVAATVTASQQHLELLARIFAETGMKDLFRGILRLICQYQDRPKMVRLRNTYVEIDPRPWNADMDVSINVALGGGLAEERIATLMQVAAKQEQIILQLGPSNPLCGLDQYRDTLGRILELSGFKDTTKFFKAVPPGWEPPPAQPKPTPEEIYAEVEQAKLASETQQKNRALDIQQQDNLMRDERERARIESDALLRAADISAKSNAAVDKAAVMRAVRSPSTATQE